MRALVPFMIAVSVASIAVACRTDRVVRERAGAGADAGAGAAPTSISTPPPAPVVVVVLAPSVTFERIERRGAYDEHVVYPKLAFSDATLTRDVNLLVAARVRRMRDAFAADVRAAAIDFAAAAEDDPSYVRPTPFLAVSCDVPWASNDLLSIGCDEYAFVGGAHGNKSFQAIDLELPSLRPVKLRDVLVAAAPANGKLRALCDASLVKTAAPDAPTLDDGFGPLSFDTFVFSPRGVRFEFKDQFPFVIADAIEPEVSYADLAPILAPGGPASRVRPGVPHASVAAPYGVSDARAAEGG